jgi:hypothetical protein
VVLHTVRPAMRFIVIFRGRDRAYLLGSRRLIALDAAGAPGVVRRFRTRGLAEAAARRAATGALPRVSAWDRAFGVTTGEYRAQRRDDHTLWLSRVDAVTGVTRWSTGIPVSG